MQPRDQMHTRLGTAHKTPAERLHQRHMQRRVPQRVRRQDDVEPPGRIRAPRVRHRAAALCDRVPGDVVGEGAQQTGVGVVARCDGRAGVHAGEEDGGEACARAELEDAHGRVWEVELLEVVCEEEGGYPDGGGVEGPVGGVGLGCGEVDLVWGTGDTSWGDGIGEDGPGGGE